MHIVEKRELSNKSRQVSSASTAGDEVDLNTQKNAAPAGVNTRQRIPILLPQMGATAAMRTYCEAFSTLVHGQAVDFTDTPGDFERQFNRAARGHDLILVGMPEHSVLERLLFGCVEQRAVCKSSATVLVVQAPRWPIRNILLVLRVQPQEAAAIGWAGRISHESGAGLTIQPLVPEQPLVYGPGSRLHMSIDSLLTPGTYCGEQLRAFLNQLRVWDVQGTLRVRQGDPLRQICTEIEAGDYDLVIMGAEPHGRLQRWVAGEFVAPLMSLVNRPMLIVGTRYASRSGARRHQALNEGPHGR